MNTNIVIAVSLAAILAIGLVATQQQAQCLQTAIRSNKATNYIPALKNSVGNCLSISDSDLILNITKQKVRSDRRHAVLL